MARGLSLASGLSPSIFKKLVMLPGLTVLPSEKGNGLGKSIHVNVMKRAISGMLHIFFWFHKSLNLRHSNYRIQTRADPRIPGGKT